MKKSYQPPMAELLLLTTADILLNSLDDVNAEDDYKSDLGTW